MMNKFYKLLLQYILEIKYLLFWGVNFQHSEMQNDVRLQRSTVENMKVTVTNRQSDT